jgi:hypothetical protein
MSAATFLNGEREIAGYTAVYPCFIRVHPWLNYVFEVENGGKQE